MPKNSQQLLIDSDISTQFPKDLTQLEYDSSLGGGTASTFKVTDIKTGKDYVLKLASSELQLKIEILMNVLYRRLGVPVPNVQAWYTIPESLAQKLNLKKSARMVQLSPWIEADSITNEKAIIAQARKDFAVHAFMGNIDVAKVDNYIQDKSSGTVLLIDSGANFIFKSLGTLREETAVEVGEINSLRIFAKEWFADLDEEEIARQVRSLIGKRDVIEHTMWEISQQLEFSLSLQKQLLAGFAHRLDNLAQRYGFAIQPFAKRDKAAIAGKTAAGVMHLQRNEANELLVLLSRRTRHNWCDNFGGKSDEGDLSLAHTAQRECHEESNTLLYYSERELTEAPFHDLITHNDATGQYLYRMYFVESTHPLDISYLVDSEHSSHHWVCLREIQKALLQGEFIVEEEKRTIQVPDVTGQNVIIFPPLYHMLSQEPVKHLIAELLKDQVSTKHTQGTIDARQISERNPYRPLTSPTDVIWTITNTLLKKSNLHSAIKHRASTFLPEQQQFISSSLSPSEEHLRLIMGDDFQTHAAIEVNVETFLKKYYVEEKFSISEKQRLVNQAKEMILQEKAHPERVFFYHGVNDGIAYVYTIYTVLYQLLEADSRWITLRTDNILFHRLLNIQEFIAYFQEQSPEGIINNYTKGFMECAISVNIFLFGNHDNSDSCSINYYTSNTVLSAVNLRQMLLTCLQPMRVSSLNIDKLLKLVSDFPWAEQGVLYQISLPRDVVNRYAYTTGSKGCVNPFLTESNKTTDVSQLLDMLTSGKVGKEYISRVQARVMLPPDVPVSARTYHWGPLVPAEKQQRFNRQLERVAQDIVFEIINHRNPFSWLNSRTPLIRYMYDVYRQAGLNAEMDSITDELVLQLLEARDFESIKTITELHPEYKDKPLRSPQTVYAARVIAGKEKEYMTLLERLLQLRDSAATIRAIYGERFYEGHLNTLCFIQVFDAIEENQKLLFARTHQEWIKGIDDLVLLLKRLPADNQLEFAIIYQDKITNASQLAQVLACLPEKHRLNFASTCQDKMETDGRLSSVLAQLPREARADFAAKNQNKISKMNEVLNILAQLPEDTRLDFASIHQDKIINGELVCILVLLPENSRLTFTNKNDDKIIGYELSRILTLIPEDSRMNFVKNHKDKIIKAGLHNILSQLLEHVRLDVARIHQNEIPSHHLANVLGILSEKDRLDFASTNQDKISSYELGPVLSQLPENVRVDFATKHQDKINPNVFACVLNQLPEIVREDFVKAHEDKINGDNLANVLYSLPNSARLNFAHRYQNKIFGCRLPDILNAFPENTKVAFASEYINKIKTDDELVKVLGCLPEDSRAGFISMHQDKIRNNNKQVRQEILVLIPRESRLEFAIAHQDKMQGDFELATILSLLPDDVRLDFAIANEDKINTGDQLASVLEHIPEPARLAFAIRHQDKIKGDSYLAEILNRLPKEERFDFAMTQRDKINFVHRLASIVGELPKDVRLNFSMMYQDKIKSASDLVNILCYLPENTRLVLASAHQDKIKSSSDRSAILSQLPKSQRLTFAFNELKNKIEQAQTIMELNDLEQQISFFAKDSKIFADQCFFDKKASFFEQLHVLITSKVAQLNLLQNT